MSQKRRYQTRRPARRESFKETKPLILVVTEGMVTEPEYLNGLISQTRNPRVRVEVVGDAGVPKTIVEYAKDRKKEAITKARREKDDNLLFDEVWCDFDIDEHPNIPDAKQMAQANDIKLAISNPCIELWLWPHFAEQPGMRHRHEMQDMMKQHIPNYDKHVNYTDLDSGYKEAAKRAKKLDEQAQLDNDEGRNPTTGFWKLTSKICSGT
tara:strand:+ start:2721 stop:3350 length:630 start_codon:yes stop_codon:yes gene_type:complete